MQKIESTAKAQLLFKKCHEFTRADDAKAAGFYPYFTPIQESEGPVVRMKDKPVVMAGSNNYLGLTTHPEVKEAAILALEKYGSSCSGSRYLTGTIDLHEELETELAAFMGKEAALLFSTGYQTGQGVITPLVGRGDYIISDKDNHASIVSGNLMARGGANVNILRYKHNNVSDLERRLQQIPDSAGKLIVLDGVFSTFGDIAPIDEIAPVAEKYGAQILVDDAHAFGIIGKGGRGTASEFDQDVDLTMCTFSKTLASIGGFVVGDERVINYLKHHSPALIFSASPTPASVASALAALRVLKREPHLVNKVVQNAERVRKGLMELGFDVKPGRTAIVPVIVSDDDKACLLWNGLFEAGVFANVFIAPAVPPGHAMMRNSFMASHTNEHLDYVIDIYGKVGRELGII